ncbi:mitochondrial carrier domain-containing protein, partial [Chytriomyces sp. MP71]
AYELGQRFIYNFKAVDPFSGSKPPLTIGEIALAGAFSSVPSTVVTTPMERLKVILQTQGHTSHASSTRYTGMLDAALGVYRTGGMRSLYTGTVATLARDIPGGAAYFAAYEFFYRALGGGRSGESAGSLSIPAALFAGGMSGVAMWIVAIPPDVVKSRIQAAPPGTYKGFLDCARAVVKEGGLVNGLYKGFGPAMVRAFPANAAGWFGRMVAVEAIYNLKQPSSS